MKIRIKGNSLRIRISKSEVETFCQTGFLEDKTEFNSHTFHYVLQKASNVEQLNADFNNNTITMFVPARLITDWDTNNTVGFNHTSDLADGKKMILLLEKDFKCIDNTMQEDQSDNFDNPLHTCS